jgi:hypothetical protein
MSEPGTDGGQRSGGPPSVHELLLRLDLAAEVLEGLDELGVDTRAEVEALMERLEREIGEAS